MDNLVEQVVKKERSYKHYLNILLIILVAVLIPTTFLVVGLILSQAYLITIAFFVSLFCIYGAWWFITSLNLEYEYACLSGTFRVDKIIAKRRRKKVTKLEVNKIDDMFKYSDESMSKYQLKKTYFTGAQEYSSDNYVIVYTEDDGNKYAVVFSPNEQMLACMRPYLKREIVKVIF